MLVCLVGMVCAGCRTVYTVSPPRALPVTVLEPYGGRTMMLTPRSASSGLQVGDTVDFRLMHCGLMSPIDLDGSLWDPRTGHDGRGGTLTDDQTSELLNGTAVTVSVRAPDMAELRTPLGAVVQMYRVDERAYGQCD